MNDLQKAVAGAIVNVFETGRVRGDYGAIAVLKGDTGHLSYGRSQITLGSGNLFKLLDQYCQQSGALFGDDLKPLLPRFQQKDISLDNDSAARDLLQRAGRQDPVMCATQDRFFNVNYLDPACRAAESIGVMVPLGQAVVYDSHVQGGWADLEKRIGPVTESGDKDWVQNYVTMRRQWLSGLAPPLPNTVYRMDSFNTLIGQNKWDLSLPLAVHGVTITEEALAGVEVPVPAAPKRVLRLTTPYMRGDDVKALQQALAAKGLGDSSDGVYGPLTDVLVKKWQASAKLVEDGVGPATRASLGL
jgi:chitosanase